MKTRYALHAIRYLLVFLLLISACATTPQITEKEKMPSEKRPSMEEQGKNALDIFTKILEVIDSAEDRQSVLPQIETLYMEIVENYPDVLLAEESCWRVITMNIEDYKPPRPERAERLYQDFIKKYPGSPLHVYLEQSFGQFYYGNKMWDRLLRFFTPQIKNFIKTGKLNSPYHMFMYSEAKFNLGDIIEAEKGYKIVIEFFANTREGNTSKDRLKEIQNLKKPAGGA